MVVISAALASMPADTQTKPGQSPRSAPDGSSMSRKPPVRASQTSQPPHSTSTTRHHPGQEVRARRRRSRPRTEICVAPRPAAARCTSAPDAGSVERASWGSPSDGTGRRDAAPCARSAHQTMPDLTIIARRLANSSSTNLSNAGAGQQRRRPAVLLQRLGPGLGLGGLDDHLGQRLALLGRDAGRAVDAAPVADHDVDALLLQRRHVDALEARRPR